MNSWMKKRYIRYIAAITVCLLLAAGLVQLLGRDSGSGMEGGVKTESELDIPPKGENAAVQQENPVIRVLLLSTGYRNEVHPEVLLASEGGLRLTFGEETEDWQSGEALSLKPDDARFQKGNVRVTPLNPECETAVLQIQRSYGAPSYSGVLELRATAEGIAVINELGLEEYLCKVVPSEMPASYEAEALKAQAVCARSYAYRQMADYAYPEYEAHVNDSTDFQVYNNSAVQESTNEAVYATRGQVVNYMDSIATTYYYSTSCGKTTDMQAWGNEPAEGNAYLQSVNVCGEQGDYEKDLPWYRWTAHIPAQTLSNLIGLNTGTDIGMVTNIEVSRRGPGDVAVELTATGDKGSVTVATENKIRSALGGDGYTIVKNDGNEIGSTRLLPSAFFTVEKSGDTYIISGGGFGHGIGMSQNGANEMAKQGKNYQDILTLFYQGVTIG